MKRTAGGSRTAKVKAASGSSTPSASQRQKRAPRVERSKEELASRVLELEDRIRLLEASMRRLSSAVREPEPAEPPRRAVRTRPRCPGCSLELPKGPRKESCDWCGFIFAAAPRRRALRR